MRSNPAMAQRRDDILVLLEERPYTTTDLADVLELPSGMHQVCAQLAREGTIKRLTDGRWAHPTHPGDVAPPAAIETRTRIDGDAVLQQLRGGPRGCSAIAFALSVSRRAVQNRLESLRAAGAVTTIGIHTKLKWAIPGLALRQADPRPAGALIAKDIPPSWWVGASRQQLQTGAKEREQAMRDSKENRFVPFRTLQ